MILPKGATCDEAIHILQQGKFHQLPVTDKQNEVIGFVTLNEILSTLISGKAKRSDPAEKIISKQFRKVVLSTSLGRLSRILEKENYSVVLDEHKDGAFVGILTQIDLLEFISNNGSSNGEIHTNGKA